MLMLFAFIILIIISILIGQDANERGMEGVLWGIAVFLLPIVAIPMYLIVRKPRLTERR